MIIENDLVFSNNGIEINTDFTYKVDLYNIINKKTYTTEGTTSPTSDRFITLSHKGGWGNLIKGKYKGKLYINDEIYCTFIAIKELSSDNKYRNDEGRTKYVVE